MASVPDPQLASPSTVRRGRFRFVAGGVVLALVFSACGGDDDSGDTTTAGGGATETAATTPAPTAASPEVRLGVKLTPEQAGTPDRPQAVRIAVDLRIEPSADAAEGDVSPVRAVDLAIPPGVLFRAEELSACAEDTLADEGPSGCPKASRIGSGTIDASAGDLEVEGQATAVYGGDDRVLLWVEIANPVSVAEAISGRLEEQPDGGYRLALQVPEALQDVAGLPVALDRLRVSLGRGGALATTACSDGGLPFSARLDLVGDLTAEAATTAVCR